MSNKYKANALAAIPEFRTTSLEDYLACPRKWYIKNILGLESQAQKVAADFGSAFHEGVAVFYKGGSKKDMLEAFAADWKIAGDSKHSTAIGITALSAYHDTYQLTRDQVNPAEVEIRFELAMPNGTMLMGTIDRIIRPGNCIGPQDTKTTGSSLTDYFWNRYVNSFQLGAYEYACRQLFGKCDYVEIDAVKLVPGKDGQQFSRRPYMRTELQQAEWLNTYLKITNQIVSYTNVNATHIQRGQIDVDAFFQNHTSCDRYGSCEFLGACRYGLSHPSTVVELTKSEGVGE